MYIKRYEGDYCPNLVCVVTFKDNFFDLRLEKVIFHSSKYSKSYGK
jgi:hypothetical protein